MKALGYERYSSLSQSEASIVVQKEAIEKYCEDNSITLVKHYSDYAISGRDALHRPEFLKMIDEISTGEYQFVIVYTRDRFSRSMKDFVKYLQIMSEYNCNLRCVNGDSEYETATSKLSSWILMSLSEYYSDNLKRCCGQLVYIPYFREFDFSKEDERQYYNMKYYCLMPGVINADKIILASQSLKDVYIEKLIEEYGQELRVIFEEKICVDENNLFKDNSKEKARDILKDQIDISKKIVIFYTDISLLYQYKDQAIKKIQSVLDTFKEQKSDITLIWAIDSAIESELPDIDKDLYAAFAKVKEEFEEDKIGYINKWNLDLIADVCDAYYGDSSPLMQKILDKEKPIMLCNYRV